MVYINNIYIDNIKLTHSAKAPMKADTKQAILNMTLHETAHTLILNNLKLEATKIC